MDPVTVLWAAAFVLPVVFITALCIGCRRKIPVHITETSYYDDKVHYNPPSSSFIVMKGPSNNIMLPRTSTSQPSMYHYQESLTVPRSPLPSDSRRSSVGKDIQAFQCGNDAAPISPGLPSPKIQAEPEDDDDYDDNFYKPNRGYIEVLPDDSNMKPAAVKTGSSSSLDNRESLSSAIYINVDNPAESKEEAADDQNYVNVNMETMDSKESLEYVNVDEAVKPQSSTLHGSDDDDLPDYENMGNDNI